jgi:hypothetical protein
MLQGHFSDIIMPLYSSIRVIPNHVQPYAAISRGGLLDSDMASQTCDRNIAHIGCHHALIGLAATLTLVKANTDA